MPYIAAVTQSSWIQALQKTDLVGDVNFWRPGRQGISPKLIGSSIILVRKGKSPRKVMGFAKIKGFDRLTIHDAWQRWNVKNGVNSLSEFVSSVTRVAKTTSTNGGGLRNTIDGEKSIIGCLILTDIFLFSEETAPTSHVVLPDFPNNVVSYKTYPDSFPDQLKVLLEQSSSRMEPSLNVDSRDYVIRSRSQGRFSIARSVWKRKSSSGVVFFLEVVDLSRSGHERIFRIPSERVDEEVIKKIGWQDGLRIYIQVSTASNQMLFVSNSQLKRRTPPTSEYSIHIDGTPFRVRGEVAEPKIVSVEDAAFTENEVPDAGSADYLLEETPIPRLLPSPKPHQNRSYRGQHLEFEDLSREAREIGNAGELMILAKEKHALTDAGRSDLAALVEHTAMVKGDGAGYDIRSYFPDGTPKYIEVKTTGASSRTAFMMSVNELAFAKAHLDQYWIYRVYDFHRHVRYFKVPGARLLNLRFDPIHYRVRFSSGTR